MLGVDDIPLTYIVRQAEAIPIIANDPILVGGVPYSISYTSFFDEMITRLELSGATYNQNNVRVFTLLSEPLNESIHLQICCSFSRLSKR